MNTLSKERLEEIRDCDTCVTMEESAAMASQILALHEERNALAAENAALKSFCKNAAFDADYEAELSMDTGGFTDALNDIETPATDAFIAEQQAIGVERFAEMYALEAIKEPDYATWQSLASNAASDYAQQLRAGEAV